GSSGRQAEQKSSDYGRRGARSRRLRLHLGGAALMAPGPDRISEASSSPTGGASRAPSSLTTTTSDASSITCMTRGVKNHRFQDPPNPAIEPAWTDVRVTLG